ncbi:MAG: hypothetical protein KOO63_03600 [Bacteroidales bacterium]|nr:hypothetical protein [Candidatus Latescibacterota bacterium]
MGATVSRNAALARVRRSLNRDGYYLSIQRNERAVMEYGRYWVMDCSNALFVEGHNFLEDLAKSCEVLRPGERVEED